MKWVFLLGLSVGLWAQTFSDLTPKQQRVYQEIAQSVSAPCCQNGIPVAYHESGMALHVRDLIVKSLTEGKSKSEIWKQMEDLRLGQEQMQLIFTVPQKNWLGYAFWLLPVLFLGVGLIVLKMLMSKKADTLDDQELFERYRDEVLNEVKAYL